MPRIELETDGSFHGSILKIDGEQVHDCFGFELKITPETGAVAIVHYYAGPAKFGGELKEEAPA